MYIKHPHRLAVGESKCSLSITSPLFLSQWLSLCHTHTHACFNKIWVLKKADLFNTSCRPTAAAAAIQGFYIKRKQSSQICQVTSWITLQQKPCGPFLYQNLAAYNNNTASVIFSVYRQCPESFQLSDVTKYDSHVTVENFMTGSFIFTCGNITVHHCFFNLCGLGSSSDPSCKMAWWELQVDCYYM